MSPDANTKGFIVTTAGEGMSICADSLAPVPKGPCKEGQMMPVHAEGCLMEKECPNQDLGKLYIL